MALIDCVECKGKMSHLAFSCPHCGHPNEYLKIIRNLAYESGKLDYLEGNSSSLDGWMREESDDQIKLYGDFFKEHYDRGWDEEDERDEDEDDYEDED